MNLKNLTNKFLEKIISEIKRDENMNKIHNNIIDPLVNYTFKKIHPYIITLFVLLILIFPVQEFLASKARLIMKHQMMLIKIIFILLLSMFSMERQLSAK